MERKWFPLTVKAADDGTIEGYGSVFDVTDLGGDVVAPGAFAASLASGRRPKMLRDHDPAKVIGTWDEVREDDRGLRLKGRLVNTPLGQETRTLVQAGALDGLSIGYRVAPGGAREEDGARVLREVELWEVSVVTFPMNEAARMDAAKAWAAGDTTPLKRIVERAAQDAGFSRRDAKAAAAGAAKELSAARDAGDALGELVAHMRAVIG